MRKAQRGYYHKGTYKRRRCLSCLKPFKSRGIFERICAKCKCDDRSPLQESYQFVCK